LQLREQGGNGRGGTEEEGDADGNFSLYTGMTVNNKLFLLHKAAGLCFGLASCYVS
jgi:hypothetical protein